VLSLGFMCFHAKTCAFAGFHVFSRENVCFRWTSCDFARKHVLLLDIR
jgi:hypothetical protein